MLTPWQFTSGIRGWMILTHRAGRHGGGGQAIVDRYRGVGPNYAAYGARALLA